ncbi:MAG: hypothetical protein COB60_02625 [Flavobacteriaceae bacterium]|nr:MAG: hypothetical protein COB60_02625 [Flavobacteriaceae bacterium]
MKKKFRRQNRKIKVILNKNDKHWGVMFNNSKSPFFAIEKIEKNEQTNNCTTFYNKLWLLSRNNLSQSEHGFKNWGILLFIWE